MNYAVDTAAPFLEADAFVRGEARRRMSVAEFRGTWVVFALGARRTDVLELAKLEEAFAATGAVILAATPDDWHGVEHSYAGERVRFPILAGVGETRRVTVVIDPGGVVRYVGLRQSARELLATVEELAFSPVGLSRAA
jgi:alkyl hydroperoxide reductase subunit AhpC